MEFYDDSEEIADDINIYARNVREGLLEDDEIAPFEEGFLNGYEGAA